MAKSEGVHFIHATFQKEDLYFVSLLGVEELGRPYNYEVQFCCKENITLDPNKFLGQKMSVEVKRDSTSRFFHGVIRSFRQEGKQANYLRFRVDLVPSLWLLTQASDCRIFQNKSVVDIVNDVHSNNKPKANLSGKYPKIPFCSQYRESDFDFVNRLLESEGIYYYFSHEKSKHEMHLVDSNSNAPKFKGGPNLVYRSTGAATTVDHIYAWNHSHQICTGKFELKDFDFEKPDVPLETKSQKKLDYSHSDLSVFDYPGKYIESKHGEHLTEVRLNEILSNHETVEAASNCQQLSAGDCFTFKDHATKTENGDYLILSTRIEIKSSEFEPFGKSTNVFKTSFRAIRKKQQFQPKRVTPKPFVRGPQTAIVVGKKGEEIWTDKYGRIKVQFHWDREGKKDENSSCWIRVSQAWAGNNWGSIQLPRIGQEVIVEFLEGDPDQPIITGRVYNAKMPVPYELPANQTQSGILSRSLKKGNTKTFNELRFEDKKDSEEIYFHAEKDFRRVVENDDTLEIGLEKKDKGDQTITIHNDRTITLNEGNDSLTVKKGNLTTTVDEGDLATTVSKGNFTTKVDKGDLATTVSKGNFTTKVDAGTVLIKAAKEITLQVGGSKITIKPDSIVISAPNVKVEGKAKAEVTAPGVTIEAKMKVEVKGLTADLNGSGITNVKGGIVNIN
ncbi:MAG: type VI secretion system Vgr family protein [Pirellulales bacterium]